MFEFNRKTAGCNENIVIYVQPNRCDKQLELFECEPFWMELKHAVYENVTSKIDSTVAVSVNNAKKKKILISMLHKTSHFN